MPTTPYIIYGKINLNLSSGPATSNNVTLKNETTNETISTITNSNGQYIFDLANLTSGYTDGDFILIRGTGGSSTGHDLKFKAICRRNQAQIEGLDINYEI